MTGRPFRRRNQAQTAPHALSQPASQPAPLAPPQAAPRAASPPDRQAGAPQVPAPPARQAREKWRGWGTQTAAAAFGLGMAVLPAVSGRAISLAVVTVVLAAASLEGPFREWRGTGALAAAAAALACMAGHPADLTLAAEGLLILGYLGLLAAPPNPHGRATRRWLRQQLPLAACGITATVLVLFLLTVPVPTSAWLVAAGAAGAVAAAALALPRRPREPR